MKPETVIKALVACPTKTWRTVTMEMAWCYRKGRTHSTALSFVIGGGSAAMPTRNQWDQLREEVNRRRHLAQMKTKRLEQERRRLVRNEYQRIYKQQRRDNPAPLPVASALQSFRKVAP